MFNISTFISDIPLVFNDIYKGSTIRKDFSFYRKTATWDAEEVNKYQLKKLKDLLRNASENSTYYKDLFKSVDFKVDNLNSVEDLNKLPILTKEDIINNTNNILSKEKNIKLIKSSSSGTTGIPINYYHDIKSYSAGIAAGYFIWSLSGWRFSDRSIHIWGNPSSIKKWNKFSSITKRYLFNQIYVPSFLLNNPSNIPSIIDLIRKNKPKTIDGYTSSIVNLAMFIKENNIEIPKLNAVFTTAENLLENQIELIESAIGPVSDTYGCGEINSIAVKPVGCDKFYIIDPHVVVECNDIDGSDMKSIIVTDLDNYGFPFIRYKIGDLVSSIDNPSKNDLLPFRSFKNIYGRTAEIITLPNGKSIHPINMLGGTLFRYAGGIVKHKVVWTGEKLLFIFVTNNNYNKQSVSQLVENLLKPYEVDFEIIEVDNIPIPKSGKHLYFENQTKIKL